MEKLKTIIFDFDGTIADSIIGIRYAVNKTLHDYHIDKEYTRKEVESFVGNGALVLFFKAFNYQKLDLENRAIYNDFMSNYEKYQIDYIEVYPHIKELFELLNENDINIMIYSNKPNKILNNCIKNLFRDINFKGIIGMKEGYTPKPNPDLLNKIIKDNGLAKDEIIYVGDSLVDIQFGNALNVEVIAALYGYGDISKMKKEKVYAFVNSSEELLEKCKKILVV